MTVEKRDQYKECNTLGEVSVEDFRLQFCARCIQPECTRSQHGKSKFDQRVTTWESRLFIDVPRMSLSDPRFSDFQAKRFHQIDTGRVPEIQGWTDPRDLEEPSAPEPDTYEVSETKQVEVQAIADIEEFGVAAPASEPQAVPQASKSTSNRRGQMLKGKKVDAKPTQPVFDPWVGKKPPEGKVVQPGAKIRLGKS